MTHRLRRVTEPRPPDRTRRAPRRWTIVYGTGYIWVVSSGASGATYLNIMCHAPPATMAFPGSVKQVWNRRGALCATHNGNIQMIDSDSVGAPEPRGDRHHRPRRI